MDAIASMYPSAAGGSGVTISPLATPAPVAAPVVVHATVAPATPEAAPAASTQAAESFDSDDYVREFGVGRLMRDGPDGVEYADEVGQSDAEPVEAAAYVQDRSKIAKALADVRDVEPPADSVTAYANFARPVEGVEPIPEGLQAMVKLGLGVTQARAVWDASVDAIRNPVQTNIAGAEQTLRAEYGDSYDTNLTAAREVIAKAEGTYPQIKQWLAQTGLGNDPAFIRSVVRFAKGNK